MQLKFLYFSIAVLQMKLPAILSSQLLHSSNTHYNSMRD